MTKPDGLLLLKALTAVLLLPGTMGFLLPLFVIDPVRPEGIIHIGGLLLVAAGISLLGWCVREFLVVGRGTLAPWWPPQQLVTSGPFALSRNPMYVAMAAIALGWAVTYWSRPLFIYASILICAFHVRILLGEEPTMAREFAGTWTNYAARVPRWIGRAAVRQQVEHSQRDQ